MLSWSGITRPPGVGLVEALGIALVVAGSALALGCILTFSLVGKGTPAPFDPPRHLVVTGPYRYLRNPMYLGAFLALSGAALVYRSLALLGYAVLFLVATHLFVVGYEEPTLARTFGDQYRAYQKRVHRWVPGRPTASIG